ncbi:unnamed protein product, partial [Meganyctiphanes norvegica]
ITTSTLPTTTRVSTPTVTIGSVPYSTTSTAATTVRIITHAKDERNQQQLQKTLTTSTLPTATLASTPTVTIGPVSSNTTNTATTNVRFITHTKDESHQQQQLQKV